MLRVLGVRRPARSVTGVFHCPECGGDRTYRERRSASRALVRRARRTRLVECGTCRSRYGADVLDVPTSARLEELLWRGSRTAAVYVLTGLLAEHGRGGVRRPLEVLHRLLGPAYGPDLLSADLAAHREGSDLQVLAELAPHLSAFGKEGMLRGLADLVVAVDPRDGADWSRLGDVGRALGVPPARLRDIADEASTRAWE